MSNTAGNRPESYSAVTAPAMENLLPTITIVLAEISAGLLIVLGFLLYRFRRLRHRHQAEIDTLMGIAGNSRIYTASSVPTTAGPESVPASGTSLSPDGDAAPEVESAYNDSESDSVSEPAIDKSSVDAGQVEQGLSGIRNAIEHLTARLDQFRHEHNRLASQLRAMLEEGNNQIHNSRCDLDKIFHAVNAKGVDQLSHSSPTDFPTLETADAARSESPKLQFPVRQPSGPQLPDAIEIPGTTPAPLEPEPEHEPASTSEQPPAGQASPAAESRPGPDPETQPQQPPIQPAMLDAASLDQLLDTPHHGINVEEISLSELDVDNPHGLPEEYGNAFSSFNEERIFFQSSLEEGREQGWYFNDLGDTPHGPFGDRETAARVLAKMHHQRTLTATGTGVGDTTSETMGEPLKSEKKAPG